MQQIEIRVKGHIDPEWSTWLGVLSIEHTTAGETAMTVAAADQATIYEVLERLSGLGLELVSVAVKEATLPAAQGGEKM